jgi:hypothetical protein
MFEIFGRLWVGCWWDGNTYEDAMIKEWADEVTDAAVHYLGDRHLEGSRAIRKKSNQGLDEVVQARL